MQVDEKGLAAGIEAAKESMADRDNHWEVALAVITAYLSASAEPVAWRLLQNGEIIEAADQVLADDTVTWLPLQGWEIGLPYYSGIYVPARRAHPTLEVSDV
jgi:hypothetical protein